MKVFIRHQNEIESRYFCECSPFEVHKLPKIIEQGGGVVNQGEFMTDVCYQFTDDNGQVGAEIIYGSQ